MWPRGFPLASIGWPGISSFHRFEAKGFLKPIVQQGLIDGDPDLDAIFRLTRKDAGSVMSVMFDHEFPIFALECYIGRLV
eukprot:TRINITY_DN3417_c0_g1_i1.p1 TRINITY_DN3417_c0_g1~~TRINITY_DN3417_c0_g1_i1.p1  ORF type:complete len:80 (-),score=2.63 TRINITY_DN3417_c0_g1_i1:19-258(-)